MNILNVQKRLSLKYFTYIYLKPPTNNFPCSSSSCRFFFPDMGESGKFPEGIIWDIGTEPVIKFEEPESALRSSVLPVVIVPLLAPFELNAIVNDDYYGIEYFGDDKLVV